MRVEIRDAEWGRHSQRARLAKLLSTRSDTHIMPSAAALRPRLPPAVANARLRLKAHKERCETERKAALEAQRQRLAQLKHQHEAQLRLELERSDQPEAFKVRRRDECQHHIDRVFRDYLDWLGNTQATEADSYLQVVAVFIGRGA